MVDAPAGAELVADTVRAALLRALIPPGASLAVPEPFHVEVAGVIRRWELRDVLAPDEAADALDELVRWPLRTARVSSLLRDAWRFRANMTVSDGL